MGGPGYDPGVRTLGRITNPTMIVALIGAAATVACWAWSCLEPEPLFRYGATILDGRTVVLNDGRVYVRRSRQVGDVVSVRFGVLTVPWVLLFGWGVRRHVRHVKPELRRARGLCPGCGYDLRATPGRCPECGRVV